MCHGELVEPSEKARSNEEDSGKHEPEGLQGCELRRNEALMEEEKEGWYLCQDIVERGAIAEDCEKVQEEEGRC